jgi:hypothetical protein
LEAPCLSSEDRTAFIGRFGTGLHVAHGAVMREYVSVPADLLADTDALGPWFARSHAYVASLKPKPTSRR